eukprot:s2607_g4.t1
MDGEISVNVVLASGRGTGLSVLPTSSISNLKAAAAQEFGQGFLRLLSADCRPLDPSQSLETAGVHDGDSLTAIVQEPRLAATDKAFALWCPGGSVVTWGDAESGGNHGEQLKEVQHLCPSNSAFAAVSPGGKLAWWGTLQDTAGITREDLRSDVQQLQSTDWAFAAVLSNGTVVAWGDPEYGGVLPSPHPQKVRRIESNNGSFAAIQSDGRVRSWGMSDCGGDCSSVEKQLEDVDRIVGNLGAFAAIRGDKSVITWGARECGGDNRAVQDQLKDVKDIVGTDFSFAAVLRDGSVVTWGGPNGPNVFPGSTAAPSLVKCVTSITATDGAYAALLADGQVVTWGDPRFGSDSSAVQHQLQNVRTLCTTRKAFAAIRADGSVVVWGDANDGGDSRKVDDQLHDVQQIAGSGSAFAAIRQDGILVTWGNPMAGGDSTGELRSAVRELQRQMKQAPRAWRSDIESEDTGRGQRLRQLFGGYRGQDIWAILRKLKSMDDGHGFLGFDEVQELLYLKAPSMLFLWDIFREEYHVTVLNGPRTGQRLCIVLDSGSTVSMMCHAIADLLNIDDSTYLRFTVDGIEPRVTMELSQIPMNHLQKLGVKIRENGYQDEVNDAGDEVKKFEAILRQQYVAGDEDQEITQTPEALEIMRLLRVLLEGHQVATRGPSGCEDIVEEIVAWFKDNVKTCQSLNEEKARFLHAVFDASGRGLGTGSEIASICLMVLSVLGKVTGAMAKAKEPWPPEVTPQLMVELEELVPPYAEAVQLLGSKEAFQKERVIGQLEIDRILTPSIRDAYESLPLHLEPLPPETEPPPPPGWASTGRGGGGAPISQQNDAQRPTLQRASTLPPGAEPSERHLAWFRRLESNTTKELDSSGDVDDTIHRWLVIQNHEFASIAKDLPEFRHVFCKSVCSALGLPAHGNCVEVVNVTNGSIIDSRTAFELSMLLDKQLNSPYSALRRGPLGKYLGSALLLSASPQTVADPELTGVEEEPVQTNTFDLGTPRAAILRGAAASGACTRQEEEEAMQKLRDAVRQLYEARQRQTKAKAAEKQALKDEMGFVCQTLSQTCLTLAQLKAVNYLCHFFQRLAQTNTKCISALWLGRCRRGMDCIGVAGTSGEKAGKSPNKNKVNKTIIEKEIPKEIHLAIKGLAGLLGLLDVKASISIHELREKLEKQLGIPAEEQQLILGTAPLADCASLSTALGKNEVSKSDCQELTLVRMAEESQDRSGWLDRDAWNWR